MTRTAATNEARTEAITQLRKLLTPGTQITTITRHSTDATTWISPVIVTKGGAIYDLTYLLAKTGDYRRDNRRDGLKTGGYGMSRSFGLVYSIGRTVYPNGVQCSGEGCPSNEHSNGDRDYSGTTIHSDGGYAFRHNSI